MKSFKMMMSKLEDKIEPKKVEVYEYNGKLYKEKWMITRAQLSDSEDKRKVKALTPIIHDRAFPFSYGTCESTILAEFIVKDWSLLKHIMGE